MTEEEINKKTEELFDKIFENEITEKIYDKNIKDGYVCFCEISDTKRFIFNNLLKGNKIKVGFEKSKIIPEYKLKYVFIKNKLNKEI